MKSSYDVAIIGGGVIGCAIARWMTKTSASVLVIEAKNDVATGASRANSGIVHAGFDTHEGTLMAELNVKGNAMYTQMAKELSAPLRRNGSLVLAFTSEDLKHLEKLHAQGTSNGVPDLQLLTKEETLEREPNLNPELIGALFAPTGGITCPYKLTAALAENAVANGAEFSLGKPVTGLSHANDQWTITLEDGTVVSAKLIVNAAGLVADEVSKLAGADEFKITARRGEYMLLDRSEGTMLTSTIFQPPSKMGKGILVTPTVDGNLLAGPTAQDQDDKGDVATTADGLAEVTQKARVSLPGIRTNRMITSFTGLRAVPDPYDFRIEASKVAPNFVQAAGICSPGLTSAPAIGEMVMEIVKGMLSLGDNGDFNPIRFEPKPFAEMTWEERTQAIADDPKYGQVICRCETVTEAEIVRAIHSSIPAVSLDAIKRRTRAGMGRCQGGFCAPRVMEIISRETGKSLLEINKGEPGSYMVCELLKGGQCSECKHA